MGGPCVDRSAVLARFHSNQIGSARVYERDGAPDHTHETPCVDCSTDRFRAAVQFHVSARLQAA